MRAKDLELEVHYANRITVSKIIETVIAAYVIASVFPIAYNKVVKKLKRNKRKEIRHSTNPHVD